MGRLVVALLVVALLAATVVAAVSIYHSTEQSEDRDAQARSAQSVAAVQSAFGFAAASLQGADGLLREDFTISHAAFRNYARDIVRSGIFPAVGWVRAVPDSLRATYERETKHPIKQQRDGSFVPSPRRDIYLPLTWIVPDTPERRPALGFDHLSDSLRAEAAANARDTGRARLTRPVIQVLTKRPGVTLYEPVYQPGLPLRSETDRRVALRGYVTAGIALSELARRVRRQLPEDAAVRVADRGQVLFGPKEQDDPVGSKIVVAGRPWMVSVEANRSSATLAALPIAGVGLSLIALVLLGAGFAERRERELDEGRRRAERAREREALVVQATEVLERGRDADEMFGEVARLLVPGLADCCTIDVVDGSRLHRAGIAGATPDLQRRLEELGAPDDPSSVLAIARDDTGQLIQKVTEETLHIGGDAQVEKRRALNATQAIIVPLGGRSRTLGTIVLRMTADSGRTFSPDDLALAREVGRHAGLALDNLRLFEQQRGIAGTLQQALLPRSLPSPPGLDVAARYSPGMEGAEVGGDFYDVFATGDSWLAAVGDVCGKGAEAAALTALARHTLRAVSDLGGPATMLGRLNEAIRTETGDMTFATLVLCALDAGTSSPSVHATFASGGHPAPLIVRPDGSVEEARAKGPFVGVLEEPAFELWETDLEPGTTVLLYTDGVTEARAGGDQFGEARLKAVLKVGAGLPLIALLARVEEAVVAFADGSPQDDIALLALRAL